MLKINNVCVPSDTVAAKELPIEITDWAELEKCSSQTHKIVLDEDSTWWGWVVPHDVTDDNFSYETSFYLSTHAFYDMFKKDTEKKLNEKGFNVKVL